MKHGMSFARRSVAALAVLVSALSFGRAVEPQPPRLVKQEGGGRLYTLEGLPVAVLSGTFRDMGRQYGALLGREIQGAYGLGIRDGFIRTGQFRQEELDQLAEGLFKTLPMRQKELLTGIAEGAHIPLPEAVLTACIPAVQIVARKKFGGTISSCTSGAAWGSRTADGKVVTVRGFDYPSIFRTLAKDYRVAVVYRPSDGSNAVAGLAIAGGVSFLDAMNSKGLYLEQNNGADSGGLILFSNRTEATTQATNLLFDASDSQEFDNLLQSSRFNYAMILLEADAGSARIYELSGWDMHRREAREEPVLAAGNQFLDPAWGVLSLPSPAAWYSSRRWDILMAMLRAVPGVVDEQRLKAFLDVPIYNEDGSLGKGVAVLAKNPKDDEVTVWQVISRPSEQTMWVRFPTLTGWIRLDLKAWFR